MSQHAFSRYYRPPETILTDKYDESADIWSLGCIFSEIFQKTVEEDDNICQLFVGDSCYPLSPVNKPKKTDKMIISTEDQLIEIMKTLGVKDKDFEYIKNEPSYEYIEYIKKITTLDKNGKMEEVH